MDLRIEHIDKAFDEKKIFEDASFTFEKGKIYGLLGRNGSGKTTLFNLIAHNITLDKGRIVLCQGDQCSDYNNTDIGFTYTEPHLPSFMTAYEFVRFFKDINKERILVHKDPSDYLNDVGLDPSDHHRLLRDFSTGMANKVQMLVSLMVQPPVMLLDEPLTSFDVVAAHEIKEMIKQHKKDSVIILSTHILQLAQDLCDEIVLVHNKKLIALDSEKIHDPAFEMEVVELLKEEGSMAGEEELSHE